MGLSTESRLHRHPGVPTSSDVPTIAPMADHGKLPPSGRGVDGP